MASVYYSSQTTIEAKVVPLRIKLWGDKDRDGTVDAQTLEQALKFAKEHINAMVYQRYGSQVDDWDFDTVPSLLASVSDDLAIYYLASGTQTRNPVVQTNYDNAIMTLQNLNNYTISLPAVSDEDDYQTITGDVVTDIDEECTCSCSCHDDDTLSPCCQCGCHCCH